MIHRNVLMQKDIYDRVNDAVYELWTETENFDRETILGQAEKYRVCPFEMTLDLAIWMDGIVCDYNYVFDPNVYLKRFFGENIKGNYIFLIDEAHNLVERGREMYSAAISKEEMEDVRKFVRPYSSRLYRMLGKAIRQLEAVQKECSLAGKVLENAGTLPITLLSIQGEMDKLLEEPPSQEFRDGILDFYFVVRDFLNISELTDENYVTYGFEWRRRKVSDETVLCKSGSQSAEMSGSWHQYGVFFGNTSAPSIL